VPPSAVDNLNKQINKRRCKISSTKILPIFVWVWIFVTFLTEKHRIRTFEKRLLRKALGPREGKARGEFQNEGLYDSNLITNFIRVMK
jgi:hypothetical protein